MITSTSTSRAQGETGRGAGRISGRARTLIAAALVLAAIGAFLPVFQNGFVNYDDPGYVYENPNVRDGLTPGGIAWAFTTFQESNWHPLTWISHQLDVTLFGLAAPAHHGMSLLIHALSTALLFLALDRMTNARWESAFVALVFGIHPLHVESVAWISERKDVLSACFMMLALRAYAAYALEGRRTALRAALGWYGLGLLSKPMLVTFPFVLLLLDYWPLGRMAGAPRDRTRDPRSGTRGTAVHGFGALVAEKVPFLALSVVSSVVTYVAQERGGAIAEAGPLPFGERAANAAVSYARYVGKTFVPADLAFFYPHAMGSIGPGEVALALAGLGLACFAAWKLRRTHPYLMVGWAIFLGMLVPVIGLVQVGLQAMADRYMYLPIIGLSIMAAWGAAAIARSDGARSMFLRPAFVLCAAAMAVLTWRQAEVWRSNESLYGHALAVTRGNHVAHTNLGVTLADRGFDAEAIGHFREALRLWPRNTKNASNLARSLGAVGEYAEALRIYRSILPTVRPDARLHLRLADAFAALGIPDSALGHYERALALDSGLVEASLGEADVRSAAGDFGGARRAVESAFRREPGGSRVHDMLGIVAGRENRMDEAESEFHKAVAADSTNAQARLDLGILFERTGRPAEGRAQYEEAVRLNPRNVVALQRLATATARDGNLPAAERLWLRCLEIAPAAAEVRMNLGRLYTMQGNPEKAAGQYSEILRSHPARADVHYLLGNALSASGDREGSMREYREAIRLDPNLAPAAEALSRLESAGR